MNNYNKIINMNISELAEFLDEIKNENTISSQVCNKLCEHSIKGTFGCEHEDCIYLDDKVMFEFWLIQEVIDE